MEVLGYYLFEVPILFPQAYSRVPEDPGLKEFGDIISKGRQHY
jgi:hypothetical protein